MIKKRIKPKRTLWFRKEVKEKCREKRKAFFELETQESLDRYKHMLDIVA